MVRHFRPTTVLGVIMMSLVASCSGHAGTTTRSPMTRPSHRSRPTQRILDHPVYRLGQTGVVNSTRQHARIRVTVGSLRTSTTRLSPSYGDAPAHGHYLTFRVTVDNGGSVPVDVARLDFFVRTPGAGRTTTNDGNAPYSGSDSQLDTTELTPGQRVTNDLTFDVRRTTGTIYYAPAGSIALAWRF